MNSPVVIIGSGFAAYQLVRMLRKQDQQLPVTVITTCSGDDYSKPDLSHVFSRKQAAAELIKQSGEAFAREFQINLLPYTRVDSIHPQDKYLIANGEKLDYSRLVIATGAEPFRPQLAGDAAEELITLNSLAEYDRYQERLNDAERVLVIGAGLIGTEVAMDLASSGRKVMLSDLAEYLMPGLLPKYLSAQLLQTLISQKCDIELGTQVTSMNRSGQSIIVTMANGEQYEVDAVISATGLQPSVSLAEKAGLSINRGIVVNRQLQTSDPNIYALGDCAEIEGRVLPFLQPIMLSAGTLAKQLLGQAATIQLPAMLIKVKTPLLPMQLSGRTSGDDLAWSIEADSSGTLAKAFNDRNELVGFVATEAMMPKALPLLRQLPALI